LAPVSYAGAWSPLLGPPDRLRAAARGRSGLADNEVPGGVDYDVSGTEADLVDRTELRHEPRHIKVVLAVGGVESSRVESTDRFLELVRARRRRRTRHTALDFLTECTQY
jgi:hypothetical protein